MATIREYVTRDLATLEATAPIREAARLMSERRIGSVGVREGGRIVGLVTERDLVATALAQGCDAELPIREAMRPGLPLVSSTTTEAACLDLMRDHFTRHLLVEDGGEVAGVVSMRDIIKLMLDEKQFVIEQLEAYIHG